MKILFQYKLGVNIFNTVKHGCNDHGYNEISSMASKFVATFFVPNDNFNALHKSSQL